MRERMPGKVSGIIIQSWYFSTGLHENQGSWPSWIILLFRNYFSILKAPEMKGKKERFFCLLYLALKPLKQFLCMLERTKLIAFWCVKVKGSLVVREKITKIKHHYTSFLWADTAGFEWNHSGMFCKVCKFLTFSHMISVLFKPNWLYWGLKTQLVWRKDWIHVRKCQKFAISPCRPTFCFVVKTAADKLILQIFYIFSHDFCLFSTQLTLFRP